MLHLTRDDLMVIAPRPKIAWRAAIWDEYVKALTSPTAAALFARYKINTPLRAQHVLATMAAETGLALIWERANFDVDGILRVFGAGKHSARVSKAEAQRIAALPVKADGSGPRCEALFERVYGLGNPKKAKELGNTKPGDGWRFRGVGLNQLTGREAHEKMAAKIGCPIDALGQPANVLHCFLIEWSEKNCNKYADLDDHTSVRKLINAGSLKVPVSKINGLPQAMAALQRARGVITDADFDARGDDPMLEMSGSQHQPGKISSSTEMQAAVVTGTLGGYQLQDGLANAAARTAASGSIDVGTFLLNMAADPQFWIGVAVLGTGIYLALKRWSRFHVYGV